MLKLLQSCQYNWLEIIQKIEDSKGIEINYLVSKSLYKAYSKQNHISENNNNCYGNHFLHIAHQK